MFRYLIAFSTLIFLGACQSDPNSVVQDIISDDGHAIKHMYVDETGVTDISVVISWPSNWSYDDAKNQAVPYLGASLFNSVGTAAMPPQDVASLLSDKNSRIGFFNTSDYIGIEFEFPNNYENDIVPVVQAKLKDPQFDPRWFKKVKSDLRTYQTNTRKDIYAQTYRAARYFILGEGPLQRNLSFDNTNELERATLDDVKSWYASHFSSKPMAISVVGPISSKNAKTLVDDLLRGLPATATIASNKVDANFEGTQIYVHQPDAEKTVLTFIGDNWVSDYRDKYADLLALRGFSQGLDSPLNKAIRNELRASYGFSADGFRYNTSTRAFYFVGEIEGAKLAETIDVVKMTYDAFKADPEIPEFAALRDRASEEAADQGAYIDATARSLNWIQIDPLAPTPDDDNYFYIDETDFDRVKNRIKLDWPDANDLVIVATGPNPTDLPNACVVLDARDAVGCR